MTTTVAPEKPLRLIAFDADDLAVISANLQDAQIPVSDIAYLRNERRFALAGRRFDWVRAATGGCERRATGLHFECVRAVTRAGFSQTETDETLNLLAIHFEPADPPGGVIELVFSGRALIRLEVECLEAQMHDLGPRWTCDKRPEHKIELGRS